ncbi:hypothetical protein [Marinicella meishanensis]|uniref:hypothetical protein n=1 Tax=Marinicella meishanensis TaxID=2873263 RepID=UPI001CC179B3|nr:hypothetical protein [Marinicella sp. NBU2979]
MKNKFRLALLSAVAFLALTGCQQSEDLATSVNKRWAAIIEDDFDTAYAYFSPGYQETESIEAFKLRILTAKINLRWTQAAFIGSECADENVCEVKVKIDYSYNFTQRSLGGMEVQTEVLENWIKQDDGWRFVPKSQ